MYKRKLQRQKQQLIKKPKLTPEQVLADYSLFVFKKVITLEETNDEIQIKATQSLTQKFFYTPNITPIYHKELHNVNNIEEFEEINPGFKSLIKKYEILPIEDDDKTVEVDDDDTTVEDEDNNDITVKFNVEGFMLYYLEYDDDKDYNEKLERYINYFKPLNFVATLSEKKMIDKLNELNGFEMDSILARLRNSGIISIIKNNNL